VNKYLEKLAVRIHLYVHRKDESKKKWIPEGQPIPEGYVKEGASFYRRKGQKKK
jgi:hypothetical protein